MIFKLLSYTVFLMLVACLDDSNSTTDSSPIDNNNDDVPQSEEEADFYAPAPIIDALQLTRTTDWPVVTEPPENLTRFAMGEAGTSNVFVLTDIDNSVQSSLSAENGLAEQESVSDEVLLRSIFKLIDTGDGTFYIVSTKHSNYALDIDDIGGSNAVILRDIRSGARDDAQAGYLVFTITQGDDVVLSATSRKVFNTTSDAFESDDTWQALNVLLTSGDLSLSEEAGTAFTFYNSPIDFDTPFDFNPDAIARVTNIEVTPIVTGDDPVARTADDVVSEYASQLSTPGQDSGTTTAATAMLTIIEATLLSENAQMRYPAEFYLAFRDGLLSRIYLSSDSTDGQLGQLTVPYVYFTNEADEDGVHHPFMVIASYGLPDSLALLWDVPRPPGDGLVAEYENQSVTRSIHREAFLMKIPLRDYGEVSTLTENSMVNDLASDVNETLFDHHNYASVSATGVAVDGVVIYPSYNNSLHVAQTAAELSAHGMHSGRGLGAHYHADAHSATQEGLNLYNSSDYVGRSHPPIVSMGFDGVAGYGVYLQDDTSSDGATIGLDEFGGHEHDDYAYHYHSFPEAAITDTGNGPEDPAGGVSYTAHQLPPMGAWAGKINDIPEFWDGTSPNYVGGRSVYLGTE